MAKPPCQPFQVYLKAQIPQPKPQENEKIQKLTEDQLIKEILKYENLVDSSQIYIQLKSEASVKRLQCLLSFVMQDQDQDGIQDWSAVVDQKVSWVLFPRDPDWDNDGVLNPGDPDPLSPTAFQQKFPTHLLSQNSSTQYWQKKIWQKFNILAINHTAEHSPVLLKEFYHLLDQGFKNTNWLKKVRFLYAFQKHDADSDIAAYHQCMGAISVGGDLVYTDSLSFDHKQKLLSTLAHELGHAFLLENISVSEFAKLSSEFGWKKMIHKKKITSFFDPLFFKSHPQPEIFESDYAAQNAHEWFAESFANSVLFRLGRLSFDVAPDYSKWLNKKLNSF